MSMGDPSPRDADDGTRALRALLWAGESEHGLQGGRGRGESRGQRWVSAPLGYRTVRPSHLSSLTGP